MSGSKFKHSNLRLGGKSPLHSSAVKLENDSDVTINTLSNSSVGSSMSGNTNSSSSVSGVQNPTARTVIIGGYFFNPFSKVLPFSHFTNGTCLVFLT